MRKYLMLTMALGALIAVCVAGTATATKVTVGNLEFEAEGAFKPKALPKKKLAPIALTAEGKIATKDGTHPPALREVLLETDKNGAINVKGVPVCKPGKLQSTDTKTAERNCGTSIVGTGVTHVEIAFPDSKPINVKSKLLVLNGGFRGGQTTLFIHAYITVPLPAAIVTTVKIKKIKKGRYGLLSKASIPVIAGGSGSVKDFKLTIGKAFSYKKKYNILTAKCPDGKLQAHAVGKFDDGTKAEADFVKPCTGKN